MKVTATPKGRGRRPPRNVIEFRDRVILDEDFSNQRVEMFTAVGCTFRNCRFDSTVISDAGFGAGSKESQYVDCSFDCARISAPAPGNARFERCTFTNVELSQFIGLFCQFVDCVFSGNLNKCVFQGGLPEADQASIGRSFNEFSGNDFSAALFHDVGFRAGIDLQKQKLPLNSKYTFILDGETFIRVVRERFLSETDLAFREKVFSVLRILQFGIDEGQTQLYVTRDNFPAALREAADAVLKFAGE